MDEVEKRLVGEVGKEIVLSNPVLFSAMLKEEEEEDEEEEVEEERVNESLGTSTPKNEAMV